MALVALRFERLLNRNAKLLSMEDKKMSRGMFVRGVTPQLAECSRVQVQVQAEEEKIGETRGRKQGEGKGREQTITPLCR